MIADRDAERLEAYLAGLLSEEEAVHLEKRLQSEPELAQAYLRLCREEAILREWARTAVSLSVPQQTSRRRYTWRLLVAASLILALGWLLFPARQEKQKQSRPPKLPHVALAAGVRIQATPGTKWTIQNPATVELEEGTLFVSLDEPVDGFTVKTPAAEARAAGTRFWVDVLPQNNKKGDEEMRFAKTAVYVTVLAGLVQLTNPLGEVSGGPGEALAAEKGSAPKKQVEDLALRFARYYQPVQVKQKPKIPGYTLPLDLTKVTNLKEVVTRLNVKGVEPILKKNGFAVVPGKGTDDVVAFYKHLEGKFLPIFVTTDSILHLYHVQFDSTLQDIEEREFYPEIVALTETLINDLAAMKLPEGEEFDEARQKALTYFAIALKCFKPEAKLPAAVRQKDVEIVLDKMKKHEGFWPDPDSAHQVWPLFRYAEDFSQYVPRGHYTRSDNLKKYFMGMMWLGRMTFILKGDPSYGPYDQPALVSVDEANQQTLSAAIITKVMETGKLADGRRVRDVWERIYAVTSFYVGLADDLGLQEYRDALTKICGAALDLARLANGKNLLQFKAELAKYRPPAIYSGTGRQGTFDPGAGPEKLVQALKKSQGFRFMGQRFVPDSYMMGKLVFPTVGPGTNPKAFTYVPTDLGPIRGFPRGLDVMTVLGSKRANELIHELGDADYIAGKKALSYDEALAALKKEYSQLSDKDWNRNLYWSWLHALKPLTQEFGAGYQTFMTTEAYRNKSLNTALASWAQLRHDTILYAKQSYTMTNRGMPRTPPGYVEPIPEFYARLLALTRMTNKGLAEMNVLDKAAKQRLDRFERIIERLLAIAEKELANEALSREDLSFVCGIAAELEQLSAAPKRGTVSDSKKDVMKTTLIADVHTDQNSKKVLEEGTGYLDLGLFVCRRPDGSLAVYAGPVLSYYEFKHPMNDRLTDEKWREMLEKGTAPAQPEWTRPYLASDQSFSLPKRGGR
ncbi:MAG: hypothetical protein KatS3mg105_1540 [Gemmatales bacterium]|nr:MAG: hypothetical protein KatS3mg105_1540 [Gemmatales bacterium]